MKALVDISYCKMIMDLEDVCVLIRTLEKAEVYETDYVSGQGAVIYLTHKAPDVSIAMLTDDDYAVAKMRGPKPTKE